MDDFDFDALARSLGTAGSRRLALTGLIGSTLGLGLGAASTERAEARKKKCPPCKKRKKGKCRATKPKKRPCGGKCIPANQCCTDAECGERRLCVDGACVIGQGTCVTGADFCDGPSEADFCGQQETSCACVTSTTNQTRCGEAEAFIVPFLCGDCLSDADCAGKYPLVPGVFCGQATGAGCNCEGSTFCMAPCPG